jgi:hypothetical protein
VSSSVSLAVIMFLLGVSVHGQDELAVAMTVVKRITKLQITRKEVEEMKGSFPRTLESIERYASNKPAGKE